MSIVVLSFLLLPVPAPIIFLFGHIVQCFILENGRAFLVEKHFPAQMQ
jgi:hypothetical protein